MGNGGGGAREGEVGRRSVKTNKWAEVVRRTDVAAVAYDRRRRGPAQGSVDVVVSGRGGGSVVSRTRARRRHGPFMARGVGPERQEASRCD